MFTIAWQYLTGRCVATDFTDRTQAEWPPHPDRVFQALVASWGERGEDAAEREALEWIERQDPPELIVPEIDDKPNPVGVYVPVNDIETRQKTYSDGMLALLPERRGRKERCFPYVRVGDGLCALRWRVDLPDAYRPAMAALCAGVTRIGHSSSLVLCRAQEDSTALLLQRGCTLYEAAVDMLRSKDLVLRVAETGRMAGLVAHHQAIMGRRIGDVLPPRARQIAYVRVAEGSEKRQGRFASPLLVFRQVGGARLGLRQTLDVTQAFRHALMSVSNSDQALLSFVSGHDVSGAPLKDVPHLALLPLAFVGHEHADGHLLGLALALPRAMAPALEDGLYGAVAALIQNESERSANPENENLRLVLGVKGEVLIAPEDAMKRQWNLRSEAWCRASCVWASATPIVMDRMQNARRSDPAGWAADQIVRMCSRQGLPEPEQVLVRPVSFLAGAPTVHELPPMQRKEGGNKRMVHALLVFAEPIDGPLLLGSGRFKGYGFCKPLQPDTHGRSADALSLVDAQRGPALASEGESAGLVKGART